MLESRLNFSNVAYFNLEDIVIHVGVDRMHLSTCRLLANRVVSVV